MFADGVVDLVKKGCVTNAKKVIHKGRIVGSFLIGTKKLYDFVDNNPFIGTFLSLLILKRITNFNNVFFFLQKCWILPTLIMLELLRKIQK